ncbi:MAG: LysM peptidoglycan-binding domain-containing protein [Bacteroidota bacterium]
MGNLRKPILIKLILIMIIATFLTSYPAQAEGVKTEVISNFEVLDADIRDVFRSLAELGGINVLMDPQVKGAVSIKLKHGLTIKDAIELLSQTYGYSFRWITQTRTVIIGNEKTFSNFESRETRIYHLNYADPEQVKNALKIIIAEDKIGVDTRTNQLTIKASILEHQNIGEIVVRLDREMPQLNIEARMEELTETASKELGLNWEFEKIYSTNNFKLNTMSTLRALEDSNKARLLANPNISITDSQEGKILIGDKFPVISTNRSSTGIEYIVNYIEIGTKLTVTPRINDNDIVTVSIKAEVSTILEWKKTGEGDDVPVIRTREASSVVRLREGETFVLSGLHKESSTDGTSGLPGLSKVPLIGRLFGTKKDIMENTEVVIFVTPKIIRLKDKAIDNSNVHKVGEQASNELGVSITKPVPESLASTPIINTPTVQEEATKHEPPDNDGTLKSTNENAPSAAVETVKPKTANLPLQVEPVDQEKPVEEKAMPDLAKLPKALDPPSEEAVQSTPDAKPNKPGNVVRVKIKAKKGETISSLAKKYGISKELIIAENKLKSGTETITAGAELVLAIPQNHFYEIKPKETLWRIAKRYGTTVELLMEINNITDHTKIEKGQAIMLPVPVDKVANSKF